MKTVVLLIALCAFARGADNVLTPAEEQQGFKLLFDGRSLNGWRQPDGGKPPDAAWTVEDGCLRTTATPKIREDLISQQSYGDFELKFDWRISAGANTGVKYRIQKTIFIESSKDQRTKTGFEAAVEQALKDPNSTRAKLRPGATGQEYTVAYEFQLIDDHAYPEELHTDQATGALYSMIPPRLQAAHPPDEWNQSRLVVKGEHFEHWINGQKVLDGSLKSDEARAAAAKRWAQGPTVRDILTNARNTGPVSLQHHGGAVWFKNIKIRPL